jgi:hypothetical protein
LLARLERDDDSGRLSIADLRFHGYPAGVVTGVVTASARLPVVQA